MPDETGQLLRVEPIIHRLIGEPFAAKPFEDRFRLAVEPSAITHYG